MPLPILTYRIVPTGPSSGFIEIVPDSQTVYDIEKDLTAHISRNKLIKFLLANKDEQVVCECLNDIY